jgi:lipase chaperone LimK
MKKSVGVAVAIAVLGVAGLMFWLAADDQEALTAGEGAAPGEAATMAAHVPPASFTTGLESLPPSLAGTDVDGEFEVDAAGHLKITGSIRRIFEYFLSTLGEENLASIQARLKAYIRHKLKDPAAAEATQLLDQYLAYKQALKDIPQAGGSAAATLDPQALRQQMQQVQALRQQFFTPEVVTAFFGDEEAYDRYSLDRLEVLQDKRLTAVQRAQRLAALEAQLPAPMREAMGAITKAQSLEALTADWKQRGGSAAELRQIREKLVGPEAADRLEALDTENAAWDQRMNAWYAERAAILGNKSLSEADRQREVEQARASRFEAGERLRVESLERMKDRGEVVSN